MTHTAVRILLEEHAALAAVLKQILLHLAKHRTGSTLPDFMALRAMLFYVDEFPEKRHHRQESELLFPKLRARTPLSRGLLDHLEGDHASGERRIRDLEHALLAFEMMGEARRETFETAAERYVDFYLAHMGLEEREILPLAERVLTADDWAELDEAFLANRDPLTGHPPGADHAALFQRILALVPGLRVGDALPARHDIHPSHVGEAAPADTPPRIRLAPAWKRHP
jgi:hemerythrin-like domain-containing protein